MSSSQRDCKLHFLNVSLEFICLHIVKWLHVLLFNANNPILYGLLVCIQWNSYKFFFFYKMLIIIFHINYLFALNYMVTSIPI